MHMLLYEIDLVTLKQSIKCSVKANICIESFHSRVTLLAMVMTC